MNLPDLMARRVVVCCGAGGVGKTTMSAAIGCAAAHQGRRVAVVTIDPARRLAAALGISDLGDTPRQVDLGEIPHGGALWALQLDAKATFDRLIHRHAPDRAAAERILANRIYQHLSRAVAGSQEYMAVERLNELTEDPRFDLIILDTPPAQNALDFLDAPQRMADFIEGKALRMLLSPSAAHGHRGWRMLHAGSSTVFSILERVTGAQLLRDLGDFLQAFDGMYTGFATRAAAVRTLLHSHESAFVIVACPDDAPVREAVALIERLRTDRFPVAGAIMNRVHATSSAQLDLGALRTAVMPICLGAPDDLIARINDQWIEDQARADSDHEAYVRLAHALGGHEILSVHELDDAPVDVHGLIGLANVLGAATDPPDGTHR